MSCTNVMEKCMSFVNQFCIFRAMMLLIFHVESFEWFIHCSFSAILVLLLFNKIKMERKLEKIKKENPFR